MRKTFWWRDFSKGVLWESRKLHWQRWALFSLYKRAVTKLRAFTEGLYTYMISPGDTDEPVCLISKPAMLLIKLCRVPFLTPTKFPGIKNKKPKKNRRKSWGREETGRVVVVGGGLWERCLWETEWGYVLQRTAKVNNRGPH